ncbi:MAG: TauD/TfdA family dioxygenase [Alphaproteobacteria bacterium]|nr:TauD/TfdA family dioxygenase [Alphaproteobacteria bacterium]
MADITENENALDWRAYGPATGPAAWRTADFEQDSSWLHAFTESDITEIETALETALATGKPVAALTRDDFPLPTVAAKIAAAVDEVETGRGFVLLRGIRLPNYSREEAAAIFWGMGQYIGTSLSQNPQGALLHAIEDIGNDYAGNNVRGHSTNARLRPHVDPCDIVGLFCIHPAKSGGLSTISSALTVYNEILTHHPEYLDPLCQGFRIDYAGKGPSDAPDLTSPQRIPVFSIYDGAFSCYYNAKQFERGAEKIGRPLSDREHAAIMCIEEIALRPDVQFNMGFQTGDIQLINNYTVLHSRTEYEDWPETQRKRVLLRQWWNVPQGRPLLPAVADRLGTGPRGGVNPYAAAENAR